MIDDLEQMGTNLKRHIREREEVTAALQESNERFRGIGENAQDAIITADAQGNIVYWNPAAEHIFGYGREEIAGRNVTTLLARDIDREATAKDYNAFVETGQAPFVGRNVYVTAQRKDGSEFPVELSVSAMRIGGNWQALAIARDITERKAAEEALHEREMALKDAQRLAHVGSWVRTSSPDTLTWSEELYRIVGITQGENPPRLDDLLRYMKSKDGVERLRAALVACLRDGTPFTIDLEAQRADGADIWLSVQCEAARNHQGAITALRGTVQDITERKSAEEDIARLHRQMSENVETLKRHDWQMQAVARMSDLLQACHSRGEALPIIAATAKTLFRTANGALALIVPETRRLETVVQWGENQTMQAEFSLDDCWALRTGRRYKRDGPDQGTPCRHFRAVPAGASVCLPLTVQGETSGLLHMNYPPGSALEEEEQSLMTSFADVIKLSLSNLGMREILSERAIHDQLTTLFNRHYLVETLPREILRAERDKVPLAVALLDIDHFKQLNDGHGHDAGDAVLKAVGALLRGAMRGGDIACRYGGEEFLLVLPECTQADAKALVENICRQAKHLILSVRGTPLPPTTISAGVAELGGAIRSAEALISAADRALYLAKKNGRDRVEVYSAETMKAGKARPA